MGDATKWRCQNNENQQTGYCFKTDKKALPEAMTGCKGEAKLWPSSQQFSSR
jgi:hypothetical protein